MTDTNAGRIWLVLGCLAAAAAVLTGAYSAHGLKERLNDCGFSPEEVATRAAERWDVAVRYQLAHALALVLVGLWQRLRPSRLVASGAALHLAGIAIFCGLLYVMTFTGESFAWLGAIVPLGGLSFVAGWCLLAVAAWRQ